MTDICKEYAAALFMLASEESCVAEVSESLTMVSGLLKENSTYLDMLASPAIAVEDRLRAIDDAFSGLHVHVVSFMKMLCERSYIRLFIEAYEEFERLKEASLKMLNVKVTSAVLLTEAEQNALSDKLSAKFGRPVFIETTVDKAILGGMIIEADGKVIDASLRSRLGDIKDVISK